MRVVKYLKGETIIFDADEIAGIRNGWVLVAVDSYPLGWGKINNGQLKNRYHSGWRLF